MKGKKVLSALLLALFVSQVYAQEEINPEDAVTTQHQGKLRDENDTLQECIMRADEKLYADKQSRRIKR